MAPAPKGLLRLAQVKVHSYHKKWITDGCMDILRSAASMGIKTSGVVPLPTKTRLYTIMRGPFVDKKSMTQHHHSTHKRLIEIYGKSTIGQDATTAVHFLRYLEHDILQVHPGISVRVTLFSDELAEARASSEVARAVAGDTSL